MLADGLADIEADVPPLGEIEDEIDGDPNSSQIGSESSSNICAPSSSNTPGTATEAEGLAEILALGD